MTEYSKEFLEELKKLCRDYDEEYFSYPESQYEGKSIYEHARDKYISDEEYFDD